MPNVLEGHQKSEYFAQVSVLIREQRVEMNYAEETLSDDE